VSECRNDSSEEDDLRHAFEMIGFLETGTPIKFEHPVETRSLWSRLEDLVVLSGIIPRESRDSIRQVVANWSSEFRDRNSVGLADLRRSARTTLRLTDLSQQIDHPSSEMQRIEKLLGNRVTLAVDTMKPDLTDAMGLCTLALFKWQTTVQSTYEWNTLPCLIPGDAPVPIKDVYIELYATSNDVGRMQGAGESTFRQRGPRVSVFQRTSVRIPDMLNQTLDCCLVVGEPGSGKSTVVQWITWAVHRGLLSEFELAALAIIPDWQGNRLRYCRTKSRLHSIVCGTASCCKE